MNELINGNAIKMTSIEIAELVESRHSNVKVSIDRLVKRGVIKPPALQHTNIINDLGVITGKRDFYVFEGEQGKRDSIIVVAQLSPEFTARLVDRWRELEETAVNIPKTLPEALRLAADLAEQKMQLENQLAIAAPKVEFADRVGEASGILIGNFAKVVGIGPNKLFAWMRDHKILIASGSRRNVPMQEYMDRGYFTVKETAVNLQVSMLADTAAQDPGQIPIVGMEQIRGLEKHWEARNKKRPAFLPLREVRDKSGNIIAGATPAGYTQPAVMNQALAALLQQTSADIQEVTGGSQAMQQMPSNIAQETVNNLMNRADMASFIYLDNMAKSLKRAGEVWLSMAREVYGSEREVRIVNEDGSDDIAVLSAQVVDRQTGAVVALNDLSVGRYDVTVDVGPSYTARRDATVSVLTNVLSSMLPTDPMRPAIQGIILDNIDGEGLDDFKEYNRNQLLISGIAKPRNEKEQQIVQQAQMAAQSQPNPEMVLAQAQMVAAQAEAQKATNETAQTQIKAFTAQQDAMESQANTVYKLAQARNIDDKAVMEAIRLLKDVAESQQQQFQSPPQSPADLMPS
nr:portal protein [Escherichia coli]